MKIETAIAMVVLAAASAAGEEPKKGAPADTRTKAEVAADAGRDATRTVRRQSDAQKRRMKRQYRWKPQTQWQTTGARPDGPTRLATSAAGFVNVPRHR